MTPTPTTLDWISIVLQSLGLFFMVYFGFKHIAVMRENSPKQKPPIAVPKWATKAVRAIWEYKWLLMNGIVYCLGIWWELRQPGPPDGFSMAAIIAYSIAISILMSSALTLAVIRRDLVKPSTMMSARVEPTKAERRTAPVSKV